jgi:hypothetical protein
MKLRKVQVKQGVRRCRCDEGERKEERKKEKKKKKSN